MRKDGSVLWARRTMSTACDAAGRPQYVISVVEDITERKEADERYRATFDRAPVGIMHVDMQRKITQVNSKACDILGYSREELTNLQLDEVVHPDFRDTERRLYTGDLLSGKLQSYASERPYIRKDGSPIWVNRTISLVKDAAGQPLYYVRVIEDISERKAAEERYRATFDSAPVGIMHSDIEDDTILHVNPRLSEMLGYSQGELLGMAAHRLLPAELRRSDRGNYREKMLNGEMKTYSSERRFLRKDGSELWVNRTVSLVRDATGKPEYFLRIIEDITERVLASRRLAMEHAVTKVLAEAASVDEAMPKLINTMCEAMGWSYGSRWNWSEAEQTLVRNEFWTEFEMDFSGEDMVPWTRLRYRNPGGAVSRAWFEKHPVWIEDMRQNDTFNRRFTALKLGLHSAFVFPVISGSETIGIMEFFGREVRRPDEMLLQIAGSIGRQIGQFIQRKEAEQALRKSEERYRDVFEASPLPMWVWDNKTLDILAVNEAAVEHYGYSREEFLRMNVRDIWDPSEASRYERNIRNRTEQQALQLQRKHRTKDGRTIDTEVTARLFSLGGRPVWLTVANDVSVRMRAEAALRESEEQFRQLSGNIPQVFWITDTTHRQTLYVSPAAESLLGRPLQDILADRRTLVRAVHREDRARVYAARRAAVQSGYDETYRILRPDGSIRWVHDRAFPVHDASGRVYRIAGIAEDITDRKAAEERLMHLAHYDVLTSLPNRVLFYDRLRQALAQARRNQWITGVLFVDLDRFKNINDTLGHAVGDKLLQQAAARLTAAVRAGDTVGAARRRRVRHRAVEPRQRAGCGAGGAEDPGERCQRAVRHRRARDYVTRASASACIPDDGADAATR